MKSTLSLAVLVTAFGFLAVSCSNDRDDHGIHTTHDAIGFNVIAPEAARADTASMNEFAAHAYSGDKEYMTVEVRKQGSAWTYSPAHYWPASGQLSVFAYSPIDIAEDKEISHGEARIPGFEDEGTTDMLYSVSQYDQRPSDDIVQLHFRHALAKVLIKAHAAAGYTAIVHEVDLVNIFTEGSFAFPQFNTAQSPNPQSSWTALCGLDDEDVFTGEKTVGETPELLLSPGGYQYAIPQPLEFSQTFIELEAEVFKDGEKVWPSAGDDDSIFFPLAANGDFAWEQGHSYTYNLVIGATADASKIEKVETSAHY